MNPQADDDIRADFLAEAAELLQRLSEQLVELERRPDDRELLNAVFRGFHTIKGGAGFMHLEPLVALCHAAEDVFNALRKGSAQIHPGLTDAVLEALDCAQSMLSAAAGNQVLKEATPSLLAKLRDSVQQNAPAAVAAVAAAPVAAVAQPPADAGGAISDDEFEA
ncbi:MAG: Hpt domain-containing protein, partial [Nevskia sp.]|nr:Hpt domain-containing protein [Nevskia sp.]